MISKREARKFVLLSTVRSLRAFAKRLKTGDIGMKATQKDVVKVQAEMEALAATLEKRIPNDIVVVPTSVTLETANDKDSSEQV